MLEIRNLTKKYDKNEVLKNINYEFKKGKIYGIIGRNGVGKTTLLECIANKEKYEGKILLDNKKFTSSYVTSTPVVPDFLTVNEFMKFFLDKNPEEVLNSLDIKTEDRNKLLKECSLGTKSKVQLYVNLNTKSEVILLDEPFTNIDLVSSKKFEEMIIEKKKNSIIIVSSHKIDVIKNLCDEVLILENKDIKLIEKDKIGDKI